MPGHSSSSDISGILGISLLEQEDMQVREGVGERVRVQVAQCHAQRGVSFTSRVRSSDREIDRDQRQVTRSSGQSNAAQDERESDS
jgi:hypothetical protein